MFDQGCTVMVNAVAGSIHLQVGVCAFAFVYIHVCVGVDVFVVVG